MRQSVVRTVWSVIGRRWSALGDQMKCNREKDGVSGDRMECDRE